MATKKAKVSSLPEPILYDNLEILKNLTDRLIYQAGLNRKIKPIYVLTLA